VFGPALHTSSAIFDLLGTRFIAGRRFARGDSGVVIISQSAAAKLFPNAGAVGQRVMMIGQSMTVIGVVSDMRYMDRKGAPRPQAYVPIERSGLSYLVATVRATGDPRAVEHSLREVVRSIDPQQPVTQIATMDALLSDSVKEPRTQALMLGAFGALAFIMTCIGVYGVVSYSVTQRTHEIGIRIALGAESKSILELVVGQGTTLAGIGMTIGLAASFWATRLVRASLYEVSALDPWIFIAAAAAILVVTVVASYLPARRATMIDPVSALRSE
jgi:putative ABC transport system permease protein